MANFFWVGQGYTAGVGRFDFNTPENWMRDYYYNGKQAWSRCNGNKFPRMGPSQYDMINIGIHDKNAVGSNVGSYGSLGLPPIASPCLFGGFSGNANAGVWAGGTAAGATYTSSLSNVVANMGNPNSSTDTMDRPCLYPYHYLGFGITGEVYDWLLGPNGDGVGAYAPQDLLLTTGLSGGVAFNGATAQRAFQVPKLKVANWCGFYWSGGCSAQVDFEMVKSYNQNLSTTGLMVNTSIGMYTPYTLSYNPNLGYNGNEENLLGNLTIRNATVSRLDNYTIVGLDLQGVTCGVATLQPTRTYISPASRFSTVSVRSGNYSGPIHFGGSMDTKTVMTELGVTGGLSGGAGDSMITVENGYKTIGAYVTDPGTPYLYFGAYGLTSSISTAQKIQFLGASGGWELSFVSGASAGVIEANSTTIAIDPNTDNYTTVRIGTLGMSNNSVLDFASNPRFNNWLFGSVTGSASSSTVVGGIVFRDETATIKGSEGLRLFNTQVVLGGRYDVRAGKVTDTSAAIIRVNLEN
jgi:hypothetical protein